MSLLACHLDSRARTLQTELLRWEPDPRGGARALLADTVLYPEGGGQPADHGWVAGVAVDDVQRDAEGLVWHHLATPVEPGPVEVVVAWDRRFDHMQQHTAQHLITAVAQAQLGRATVGFNLGTSRSTIDLDGPTLSAEELGQLEALVNAAVREDRTVVARLAREDELEALGVRSRRIAEHVQGPIRLIEIEGIDLNTCGGTHVARLGELQLVHLQKGERYKGGTRLSYLAGGRVLADLRGVREREHALNEGFGTGPEEHVEALSRLLADRQAQARQLKAAAARLAELEAARLLGHPGPIATATFEEADMGLLRRVGLEVRAQRPELTVVLLGGPAEGEGVFLVCGPPELVAELGPRVAQAVGGRGGGRGELFQGKAAKLGGIEALSLG